MRTLTFPLTAPAFDQALYILHAGRVVVHPTDTIYGLGTLAQGANSARPLDALKGRHGPYALLAADLKMAERLARFSPVARRLAARYWPGPLTLILPARIPLSPVYGGEAGRGGSVPAAQNGTPALGVPVHGGEAGRGGSLPAAEDGTLALRVPAHEGMRALLAALGEPLWSTSVNTHAEPPRTGEEEIVTWCGEHGDVGLFLRDAAAFGGGPPSTQVRVTDSGEVIIVRQGALALE